LVLSEVLMPQLHLTVSDEIAAEVTVRARARGLRVSELLAEIVCREMGGGWPDRFFEEVIGGWKGDALERPPQVDLEAGGRHHPPVDCSLHCPPED
jgi:hypothetical protein